MSTAHVMAQTDTFRPSWEPALPSFPWACSSFVDRAPTGEGRLAQRAGGDRVSPATSMGRQVEVPATGGVMTWGVTPIQMPSATAS